MVRGIFLAYLAYLLLPIVLLMVGSVGDVWTNSLLPTGLTTRWYSDIWHEASFRRAFFSSFVVATGACLINLVLGVPLAYSLYHRASRQSNMACKLITVLPVAAPTITLGFGYIIVFNTEVAPWLGTLPLLMAAHAIHTLPYLVNTLLSGLRHSNLAYLQCAAATLGATERQQFCGIAIPSLQHSIYSGLTTIAAISIGEFGLSNLVSSFHNRTYPVILLQAFYGATGFACAATMVLLLLAIGAVVFSFTAAERS